MMKAIAYTRPDGGIGVIVPVINTYPQKEEITEDQALMRALKDIPSDALNAFVVDEVPDSSRQSEWRLVDGRIVV